MVHRTDVIGGSRYQGESGCGIDGVIHTGGAVTAADHLQMDEVRTKRTQVLERMPLPPCNIGDEHPGRSNQLPNQVLPIGRTHVDLHRPLTLVQPGPVDAGAAGGQRPAVIVGRPADGVDADHLGAELGQGHAGQWHRDETGDLDDPDARQRQG